MSNKLIAITKVKQIFKWHSEGVSKKKMALRAGVTRNTVLDRIVHSAHRIEMRSNYHYFKGLTFDKKKNTTKCTLAIK
jgi:hypothetical protein